MAVSTPERTLTTSTPTSAVTENHQRSAGRSDPSPSRRAGGLSLGTALGWITALAGFIIGSRVIDDNSFLTHLANGREALANGAVPRVDPYSFTAAGQGVTVQSWLMTVVYAWLTDHVGGWSVRLVIGGLTGLLGAAIWRLTSAIETLVPRLALAGMVIGTGAFMWGPRPSVIGLLGLAAVLLVHQRVLPMWSLLPVMWIWVNSHGSFPLAGVAIACFGLGHVLDERAMPAHELRVGAWLTAGTLLGAINPLGLELLWFPVHLMGRREALVGVAEWSPPVFDEPLGLLLVAMVVLHVFAAVQGARWKHLLPGAAFLFISVLAVRNLAPASLIVAAALAPHLQMRGSLVADLRGLLPKALTAVAVAAGAIVAFTIPRQDAFSTEAYPVASIDWLEARDLVANPDVHLVHRDTVGNYLEFRFGNEASVFVDDRFDFYPTDVLDDHRDLFFGGDYRDILDRHRADVVLWEEDTGFARWLEEAPDWGIDRRADGWMIACRLGSDAAVRCE